MWDLLNDDHLLHQLRVFFFFKKVRPTSWTHLMHSKHEQENEKGSVWIMGWPNTTYIR